MIPFNDVNQLCLQRSRRQLLVKPPTRLELVSSPYQQGYTQQQLDMRRKVEILRYTSSASNSKTNNLTKAAKFTQMVAGSSQRRSYTNQIIQEIANRVINCPADDTIKNLTSSCDVPGPIEILQFDPNIPLYNYIVRTNVPSTENSVIDPPYIFYPASQPVSVQSGNISDIVGTLYIPNTLNTNTFDISVPTTFSIQGNNSNSNTAIDLTLSAVYIYIYYNSSLVTTNDDSYSEYNNIPPVVTLPLLTNIQCTVVNSGAFQGALYLGNITAEMTLYTQPKILYDVKFKPVFTNSSGGLIFNGSLDKVENNVGFTV